MIRYVPADQVLEAAGQEGGSSFDAPGAEFTHRDGKCTFEVLIDQFHLGGDPALVRLAVKMRAGSFGEDGTGFGGGSDPEVG